MELENAFEGGHGGSGTFPAAGSLPWDDPGADILGDIRRVMKDAASRPFVPFTPVWGRFTPEAVFAELFTAFGRRGGTRLRCAAAAEGDEFCPWSRRLNRDRRGEAPAYAAYRRHLRRDHQIEPVL